MFEPLLGKVALTRNFVAAFSLALFKSYRLRRNDASAYIPNQSAWHTTE